LSDATTHRCWNLDAWQQHIKKIEKLQAKTKKNTLYRVWLPQLRSGSKGTLDESENTINNQAQVNAYESLFQTLTQKKWFAGGLPGNGMPMIITNAKKKC
jgi:hypothetical protein